ncbi:MAG: TetR/AcrR family transcriptional regulator [Anaerolineales bacterium]|jgi:AcrR family transcriptional regulator
MPKGVRMSEEDRDRQRRRIFQAASQLFIRQGFHETSMQQVAQATGLGKSTLYDYFASKEEILLFFVESLMDVTHVAASEISAQDLPAPEKLSRIVHSLWQYLEENRAMAILIAKEASRLGEEATRRLAVRRAKYRHILEGVLAQGVEEGSLRPMDPRMIALALHSMISVPFYDWLVRPEADKGRADADALLGLFLHGVMKR